MRLIVIVAVMLALSAIAGVSADDGDEHQKVTICHATHSDTNPYVVITVDEHAWENGHSPHNQHDRDFLAEDGTCTPATATSTPSPTNPPVSMPTPTPVASCQEDEPCWDCATMGNLICGPVSFPDTGGKPPVKP